ncbi:hypothetical protein OSB04_010211, partial [Centaurea solstitialis]
MEIRQEPAMDNISTEEQRRHQRHPSPSKHSKAPPVSVDTNSVTQRLQKELMALMVLLCKDWPGKGGGGPGIGPFKEQGIRGDRMSGDLGVSAFPEGESIFSWIGTIEGGKGTMYEGLSYKLSLHFPWIILSNPLRLSLKQCASIPMLTSSETSDKWSSAYDCRTILLSIQSLLGEPNIDSPLNSSAAALWCNQEDYRRMVHKHYAAGESLRADAQIMGLLS